MGTGDFIEDLYTANDLNATKSGHDTSMLDPIRSHKDADDGRVVKSTNNVDPSMKKANSVAVPDLPKIYEDRDVFQVKNTYAHNIKALDDYKLVKDIEEMKLKVDALESKLKQADSTISKLMEERSIT